MTRARELALVALTALGLAACAGGASTTPPDDDARPLVRFSAAIVGYPGTDAVLIAGRASHSGDLLALGVLYGFAGRLDLDLLDPADVPSNVLAPPSFGGCDLTVTPGNLRIAEFVSVNNGDGSLTIQLRNRPPEAEIAGTEVYGFMLANVVGSITATCTVGVIEVDVDLSLRPGWNLVAQRITGDDQGDPEHAETFTIDALPEEATWYVLP